MIELRLDPLLTRELSDLRLGVVVGSGGGVREYDVALAAELEDTAHNVRIAWGGHPATDRPEIAATRRGYRLLGDDPTRYRPSNEALLRRVLLGKPLPHINTAVDANTLVSLHSGWSVGCYDLAAIKGPVIVRQARSGEMYMPIGKPAVDAAKRLVLTDCADPGSAIFGCPTADAARTRVTPGQHDLLFVIFAFDGLVPEAAITLARRLLEQYCGASTRVVGVTYP